MIKKYFLLVLIVILAFILRFWQLSQNPPSLYWDEVSLGYNAYSILKTGRDEHGEFLPLARFIAFGDYKPPGYIYATVPAIKIFGLNELAVRFPSALAGVLLVLLTYFLAKELFPGLSIIYYLLSSLFVAISPWALQFSRAAFEANLAAFFNLLAVLLFLWFVSKNKGWLLSLSVICFVLSFYTFNANRIVAPLLLLGLSLFFIRKVLSHQRWLIISIVIGLLMIYPSLSFISSRESRLRFQEVSIFNNLKIVALANQRLEVDSSSWWSKIIHNRRLGFLQEFLTHYFDNFSGRFLFISGDVNPRLSVQEVGELYLFDLPFLLIGVYFLIKKRTFASVVIFWWWLVSLLPASTARETPHALRTLSLLPLPQIMVALGFWQVYQWFKTKELSRLFILVSSLALFINIFYYFHDYYIHYPRDWSREWQYGYKEAVNFVAGQEKNYEQIIVSEALGRPYIYFLFYQQVDPEVFWQTRQASRDWWGFWQVQGFGKYKFGTQFLETAKGKILLVAIPSEMPAEARVLKTINYLDGQVALEIGEFEKF